jgi:hypothetical protein
MRILIYFLPILSFSFLLAQDVKIMPASDHAEAIRQAAQKSPIQSSGLFKDINQSVSPTKWAVSVRPTFSRKHYSEEIAAIKRSKLETKLQTITGAEEQLKTSVANPVIGTNFEANWTLEGTPPDNSMAISNGGYIVSANNDGIEYYSDAGSSLYSDYWSDFFNDNSLTAMIYDPKVIYDSGADRFVLVVLHGSTAATSKVLVCFSKTNNPSDGWWVYTLTGNPLNNNCWFDYPNLGVSNNEIYISGNLFVTNGSFNQAVVYQISKAAGYSGANINWQYWHNMTATPFSAFTLVPASYGHQGNYGPGIYFVSSQSGGNNQIRLWDLSDDMSGNPTMTSYTVNTTAYSPAADASQQGTNDKLDNGDCRIQNAFYLDGVIHYVFHSDIGSGWNGINYNRLTVSSLTNQSSTFGLQGSFDYSFPAVIPFSNAATDKSVMIAFLASSGATYPQVRVVQCDHNLQWSSSTQVKSGETHVDFLSGDERWGDYTGISRRHNSANREIWLAGCYGADVILQQYNTYKTWIAEVYGSAIVQRDETLAVPDVSLFPNPTYDFIQILFTTANAEPVTIQLLDLQGKLVRLLYQDTPKIGTNQLIFNKEALSAGTYFIEITTPTQTLKNEKIIILD